MHHGSTAIEERPGYACDTVIGVKKGFKIVTLGGVA